MEHIYLNNGIRMPMVGFGTWDLRGEGCVRAVRDALDAGYRLIDTARMYGNEDAVGRAVRESGVPRGDVFITTKVCRPSTTYATTASAILDSLVNLGTDYIDLLLVHEPYPSSPEMYRALVDAMETGRVRAVGVSNFDTSLCRIVAEDSGVMPAVDQVESHVYFPQLGLRDRLRDMGIIMQSWAPFTEGKRDVFSDPVLSAIADSHGRTVAQVALRYLVQSEVPVIPKTSRRERMEENLAVLDFRLSEREMAEISSLDGGRSLFGWYR